MIKFIWQLTRIVKERLFPGTWQGCWALTKVNQNRITFNEITKRAVSDGVANPRTIDQNLVDAQQARRILDRLVGYQLSPFLWKKSPPRTLGRPCAERCHTHDCRPRAGNSRF